VQAEAQADPLVGATLANRYQVMRCIGRGGMGAVYEAQHVALGKRIAIKLLLDKYADDREAVERFHREALTATQIGNDHIVDVIDIGTTDDGRSFVAMEYLDGADLGRLLASSGPMPASRAIHIIHQVLRGLGAAHAKGIVHRDMKPDNVIVVARDDNPDFVKILDFGISKIIAAQDAKVRLTATGAVVGTPIYMAPEQALAGAVDHRADLYSVGVMLYELLAGRPPFVAESYLALVTQHLQAVPPDLRVSRPDLPGPIINAVHRALSKEPEQRFATADHFARALPPAAKLREAEAMAQTYGSYVRLDVGTSPEAMRPAGVAVGATTRTERRGRRWMLWLGIATVLAGGVAAAIVIAGRDRGATQPPAPARPVNGKLDVSADPSGVKVYVDDEYVGVAPIELPDLAPGVHRIRLEKDGYMSMSTRREVTSGETVSLVVALTPLEPPTPPTPPVTTGAPPTPPTPPANDTPPPTTAAKKRERGGKGSKVGPLNPYAKSQPRAPESSDPEPIKPKPQPSHDDKVKPNPYNRKPNPYPQKE
jgi:serine/threonine-protein kinase